MRDRFSAKAHSVVAVYNSTIEDRTNGYLMAKRVKVVGAGGRSAVKELKSA